MIRAGIAVTAMLIGLLGAACRRSDSESEPVATIGEVELTRPGSDCSDACRAQ